MFIAQFSFSETKKSGSVDSQVMSQALNSASKNNQITEVLERVKSLGSLVSNQVTHSMNAIYTGSENQIKDAIKMLATSLQQANVPATQITSTVNFIVAHADAARQLIAKSALKELEELNRAVASNKINSTDQIFTQMDKWGYHDFVAQERGRIAEYTALIASLTAGYLQQSAAEQARQFQMASTAQQLEALDSFVDKLEKRRQDEEAKKESERAAPAEERKAKKKASLKKSESKETEEKEATPTKLYNEVRAATLLKDALLEDKGLKIGDVIKDSKFQTIFEDQREEALRGALKNLVPSKLSQAAEALKAGAGGAKANIAKYDSVVQTALVSAYRKSLEQYYEQTPKV